MFTEMYLETLYTLKSSITARSGMVDAVVAGVATIVTLG
jgi:hypothetical protein